MHPTVTSFTTSGGTLVTVTRRVLHCPTALTLLARSFNSSNRGLLTRSLLFRLSVSNVADDPSRNTRDDRIVGDVAGYHCASTYQSALPNADAGENGGIAAQRGAPLNSRWDDLPVGLALELSRVRHSPRVDVVDEHDAMSDKHAVFDMDPFANECVAGDLDVGTDGSTFLNLYESANL